MKNHFAWRQTASEVLAQGDVLNSVDVPLLSSDWRSQQKLPTAKSNLIVLTQSCDLDPANKGVRALNVMCCPLYTLEQWEDVNPTYSKGGVWKSVALGRIEGVHLIPPFLSVDPRESWICDFRTPYSLPHAYLVATLAPGIMRWRLQSPFVEALSATFGQLYSRVALPTSPLDKLKR